MKNRVSDGAVIQWTNGTGTAVSSGDVVIIGNMLGIAAVDIANGASGSVHLEGEFTVPKVTAAVFNQGEMLIWDKSAGKFDDNAATPATGDVSNAAIAAIAGTSSDTTTRILLKARFGTVA